MKTLNVILFFLLAFGSIVIAAEVKSPAVLLQEGIYAEETEGNLEKAMAIYNQIRKDYNDVERIAARATYQLGLCNLKKGDNKKAAELFEEVVSYYPQQTATVKMAQEQLDKLGFKKDADKNIFEILGVEACSFIGSKYGEACAEAGMKKLYSNSHIYVVDKDCAIRIGGMGYAMNWTDKPITGKYRLSGTTNPNQKLYDAMNNPIDIEILPDPNRSGFYNVYWTPKEPFQPGGFFNYGWAMDGSRQVTKTKQDYNLTMRNHFGDHCYETFFLAVPEGMQIVSQSEDYTNKSSLGGWDIYEWKKEVPQDTDHTVNVTLKKAAQYNVRLKNKVTVSMAKSPDGDRLTVQYAVIEICKAADVPYQWDKSQQLGGEKAKQYIEPIHFENIAADEVLSSTLEPLGLKYAIDASGIYLTDTNEWVKGLVGDFFQHNYRDITSRKTIEWGNPVTDANGNVSISYKYEMIIWDKDKFLANQIFTFDKNGKYLNAEKVKGFPKSLGTVEVPPEDVSTKESIQKLVEKFFSRNYRDITSRKTIEWGEPNRYPNGNVSIRYKFEAVIWDKDKMIMNKVFTFDKNGQYVSAEDVEGFPVKADLEKDKDENSSFSTPEKTIQSFMSAAVTLDVKKAMEFVAQDSHDYDDTKKTLTDPTNPVNLLYRSIDQTVPVKFIDVKVKDTMCEAKWQLILKKDFTIEGHTFKAGDPFELDGNLHKYGDKWLITGI